MEMEESKTLRVLQCLQYAMKSLFIVKNKMPKDLLRCNCFNTSNINITLLKIETAKILKTQYKSYFSFLLQELECDSNLQLQWGSMRDYTCTLSYKICFSLLNEPPNDSNLCFNMSNTVVQVFFFFSASLVHVTTSE